LKNTQVIFIHAWFAHLTETGNKACKKQLSECKAITYRSKATIYRGGLKKFSITPRLGKGSGSGLHVDVASGANRYSDSELVALIEYTSPISSRKYVIALLKLLVKVPKKFCVVRCDPNDASSFYKHGDQVQLQAGSTLSGPTHSVSVKTAGSDQQFSIESDLLLQITAEAGVHDVMTYAGDYMQYGYSPRLDCSSPRYNHLDEYEAVDPATGIKSQVCLVPDSGGWDTKKRNRFFLHKRLYSH